MKINPFLKALGVLVSVIAVLCGIVMALSPIAKYVINHHGPDIVGREASVGRVWINPLRVASVTLYDFHLKEQNGLTDFAAFDELYADVNLFALLGKEVDVRQITLTHFTGEVMRTNNRFNFADIIEHFQTPDSLRQEPDTTPSSWLVSLRNIDIIDSRVEYRDVIRDDRWELNDINVNIPGLYFGGNRRSNAGINFQFQRGGSVGITADYTMATNAFRVHLRLDSVSADVAQPFVKSMYAIRSLGGVVSGDVSAVGNLNHPDATHLRGWVSADNIDVEDEDEHHVLSFSRLYAALGNVNLETNHIDLDTIILANLRTGYHIDRQGVNTLQHLQRTDEETHTETDTVETDLGKAELEVERNTQPRELYLTAKLLQVQNAELDYRDESMSPAFSYRLSEINAKAFNLSNHASNHIKLTSKVGRSGRLETQYRGDLDLKKGNQNLDLMLHRVDVSEFSPFTESLMAYPLNGGMLSLRSTSTLHHGQIESTNRLEVDQMEVGKKIAFSKAPYKAIPLKLGVSLLKSSQGLIVIDLPVTGDFNNPQFKYRQVIRRALAKVFFGPLMGVADKKELEELANIVDDPELHAEIEQHIDSIEMLTEPE